MAGMISRLWSVFSPPTPPKSSGALKFGVLGAANIAPLALITPAKSHPEVIVQAVSARDRTKAEAFAKAHGIPEVRDTYQEILDDPNIDCIFIPLPNGLHFEWAAKAIKAGKHVLVEKPSVSNSVEAEILFNMPELSQPNGPVLLEAFHSRFYPSWVLFQSMVDPADVVSVVSHSMIPWWGTKKTDIHFNFPLAGGSMMAMGTYNYAALRVLFGADPVECTSCTTQAYTDGIHDKCDWEFEASFKFPNGGTGKASSTLQGGTVMKPSWVTVTCREVAVADDSLPAGQQMFQTRELTLQGMIHGVFWHRIDVKETNVVRTKDGKEVRRSTTSRSHKAYTFKEAGGEFASLPGEAYWMSYRHQLEQFVNKVKGRPVTHWISGEDSLAQMKMLDMAYEKSGLGPRPTSKYRPT
ncbi:oxidoreductase [Apiospora saccharicola]|uniref:D-xylose 1-dehydrogenase (NADP(+), D-xylono-1,5-lactone-forming) n=1 Tax=Apiospora saccharicola TaxID=335842 RepID=A0ABR1UJJ0_9PEZI